MPDEHNLHVETVRKGRFHVIRILDDDPGDRGDLSELVSMVGRCLKEGKKDIAVVFTCSALLYTRSIAALIRCYAMVDDGGGMFAVVAPNPDLMHSIELAGVNTIIKTYDSEDQLSG